MRECKILTFYNARRWETDQHTKNLQLANSDCERVLKTYGSYWTTEERKEWNSRVCDHPKWEQELNGYLQAGWTIQSTTSNSVCQNNYSSVTLTFVLVR